MPKSSKWRSIAIMFTGLGCSFSSFETIALQASQSKPDLRGISNSERVMIESACSYKRDGPGATDYYDCVRQQLKALQASQAKPDLRGIPSSERGVIESACSYERDRRGPADYYDCVRQQLTALSREHPIGTKPSSRTLHSGVLAPRASARPSRIPRRSIAKADPAAKITELTLWLVALIVVGLLARLLYNQLKGKKCSQCGNPHHTANAFCPTCAAAQAESARDGEERREREQQDEQSRPNTKSGSADFDAYAVLGISREASPEEIRMAYHREMGNYHPDKVAHLGKELQELAKTKAQEINRAYEELAHS